jgi:hypothetical protein
VFRGTSGFKATTGNSGSILTGNSISGTASWQSPTATGYTLTTATNLTK